jgi:hypothetical protein
MGVNKMITRKELQAIAADMEKQLDALGYDIMVRFYTLYDGRNGCGFYYRIGGSLIFATGTGNNDNIYRLMRYYFNIIKNDPKSYI